MAQNKDVIDNPVPQEGWEKVESFFEQNWKLITGAIAGIAVIIAGIFAYQNLYQAPREATASSKIMFPQQDFERDSLQLALYGDGLNSGFVGIADTYGSTAAGNLAKGYASICFLRSGDFASAIKYGQKYKAADPLFTSRVYTSVGHAYTEQADFVKGVQYYVKAAEVADNNVLAPMNYLLAGQAAMEVNDFNSALRFFEIIENEYPLSVEGRNVDKFIALAKSKG
jgi:tetratricopeptide (TPR) repeat protein